ncbi:MAG: hypothetical protein GWN00_26120 [Aliifodinibius sp.]|nr:DUF4382 domain-containing protein [Fodinibius sp.]NIV14324.1 hypothetical protein [Fodinibius sp.]NIY28152.1 hypothetical protein [Fodinibius sp.]
MRNKHYRNRIIIFLLIGITFILLGCSSGVEESPDPGIVRVTLQSDPTDKSIVIIGDTLITEEDDQMIATIFQGRVYRDTIFSILFKDTDSFRQEDITVDLLKRNSAGEYQEYTLFEYFVPPGNYDRVQFGLTSSQLDIGPLEIPVRLPPGESSLLDIPANFEVRENTTTEITIQIKPLDSLQRFRDVYQFFRIVEVMDINYL